MATKRILSLTALTLASGLCYAGLAGASVLAESEPNSTLATAQNIDGSFSLDFSVNIGDTFGNTSTTIPHVTINGTGDGTFDFYSFLVPFDGARGIFDIDFGWTDSAGDMDTEIAIWNSAGIVQFSNDDSAQSAGASGSDGVSGGVLDSFLDVIFATAGTYVVGVAEFSSTPNDATIVTIPEVIIPEQCFGAVCIPEEIIPEHIVSSGEWSSNSNPPDTGDTYTLQVSIEQERDVPEPATLALLGLGLAGMGFGARRRKR